MPALPPVAGVIKFTVIGTTPVHPWSNVFHYAYTGSPPLTADLNGFAATIGTLWQTNIGPMMPTGSTIDAVQAQDLSSDTANASEAFVGFIGAGGTTRLAGSTAVEVKKLTNRHYRGGHPRSEIFAGIEADLQDASHWSPTMVANMQVAVDNIFTALDGQVGTAMAISGEVFVSYYSKALNPVAPFRRTTPLPFPIIGRIVQSRLGTVRRRIGRT